MTLRLLRVKDSTTTMTRFAPYFRTFPFGGVSDSSPSSLFLAYPEPDNGISVGEAFDSKAPMLSVLLGASMLGSDSMRKLSVDQYGNVRIPYLPQLTNATDWSQVPRPGNQSNWVSLTGLMVSEQAISNESNFIVNTSYIEATCSDAVLLPFIMDTTILSKTIAAAGFHQHPGVSGSPKGDAFSGPDGNQTNTLLIDSNSLDDGDKNVQGQDYTKDELSYLPGPVNFFYASRVRWFDDHSHIEVYNCSLTHHLVEANVTCEGAKCNVLQMRSSGVTADSGNSLPFSFSEYSNLLRFIPSSLGASGSRLTPTPTDQFMLGSPSPLTQGDTPFVKNYENITGAVFAGRLTTLLNTIWQASIAPGSIALGSSANFSTIGSSSTTASVKEITPLAQYVVSIWQAALLIVITFMLVICAITSMILSKITKAPDVLGYVSTMTRDNEYVRVPEGGSTLDGMQRARYLAHMKVQLADMRPEDEAGLIALRNPGGGDEANTGRLIRNRLYR